MVASVQERALEWSLGDDAGMSSRCLCRTMLGLAGPADAPADPDDLGRCLRLLEKIPEWKPRIGEMASVSLEWERLVAIWDQLQQLMREEVGIDWSRGRRAPKTYDAMQTARHDCWVWNNGIGFPNAEAREDHRRRHSGAKP